MAIKYKVSDCVNPKGEQGVAYACNRAVQERPMTAREFVDQIDSDTSYTRADVVGVLTAMAVKIKEYILGGQHVDLKDGVTDLGIISPAIYGSCYKQSAISAEGFDPSQYIEGAKINMRPSTALMNEFRLRSKLQRVPSTVMP